MKILRMTDRIRLTVGELEFLLAPLSKDRKSEVLNYSSTIEGGNMMVNLAEAQLLYLKYGLKDIKGLTDHDGKPYKLEFENDHLTEDCLSELFGIQDAIDKVCLFYNQNLTTFSDELKDPTTGKKIKGVKLEILSAKEVDT